MSDAVRSGGFPPVVNRESRVLVLGTLPGPESLRQRQYYAQSRNAFWRIMGALVGAGAVVSGGTVVPSGAMALGIPAKIRPDCVTPEMISLGMQSYVHRSHRYRAELRRID